ncbi:MAG: hypothetical protein JXR41_04295, partial [Bacteroidales bacterium]|nr:hypothetical protein [Bacteroidales bacterium]MBN2762289.1 hypothetical protein [Bacteroidales bacterium]
SMNEAVNRLNHIASFIHDEDPRLIVHSVNWFRYDPENPGMTMGWNGIEKRKDTIALTLHPLIGYYNCSDTSYMDWLLEFSKALGIDELNIDYEGGVDYPAEYNAYYQDRSWDSWFPVLLKRAEKYSMRVSVMYEPKSISGRLAIRAGRSGPVHKNDAVFTQEATAMLVSDLKLICDQFTIRKNNRGDFISNPVYSRLAGLPVIWVFGMNAGSLTEKIWNQAIDELHALGYAFVLIPNSYPVHQSLFDTLIQGLNPWLDQLFTGFQSYSPRLWEAAQQASGDGNYDKAREITSLYVSEISLRGLNAVAPVRELAGPSHFNITPLAIGFQDADVKGWGLRPPVFIESADRTFAEPGSLFRAYFSAAQQSKNRWFLVCSADDMAEHTNMLIPETEHGFSGPYAIALMAAYLGKNPDIARAIEITEEHIRKMRKGNIPEDIGIILNHAKRILPVQLKKEVGGFKY